MLKCELFALIEAGAVALTPNQRLARSVREEFARAQQANGKTVWRTPTILPWTSWLEALWNERAVTATERLPMLLTDWQELVAWEATIRSDAGDTVLLAPRSAARLAREAWAVLHAWAGEVDAWSALELNDDAARFVAWARRYRERCTRSEWIDRARLADVLCEHAGALGLPACIVLIEFETVSPQQCKMLDACERAGSAVHHYCNTAAPASTIGIAASDPRTEIELAARWAEKIVTDDPQARVGIVVHDLAQRRNAVDRALGDVLHPLAHIPGAGAQARPFNISLGWPLAHEPVVQAALALLELAQGALPVQRVGLVLRSPFLRAAQAEAAARSRLERRLRDEGRNELDAATLARLARASRCVQLAACLDALPPPATEAFAPPLWRTHFASVLNTFGWPGERTLDSGEYQACVAWEELLTRWSQVAVVRPRLFAAAALSGLAALAAETVFQPESEVTPIQVLGTLEAAGLTFDALWIAGCTADAWPGPPRPQPLLPLSWQRRVGVPRATAEGELAFAQSLLQGFLRAAPCVVCSYAVQAKGQACLASPLLPAMSSVDVLPLAAAPQYARVLQASHATEPWLQDVGAPLALSTQQADDEQVDRIPTSALPLKGRGDVSRATTQSVTAAVSATSIHHRGGASVLEAQAACPFRAYARHRLQSESWPPVIEGLTARERGLLVHRMLELFWRDMRTREALLDAISRHALDDAIARAVKQATQEMTSPRWLGLPSFAREAERHALTLAASEWLEFERERPPFVVEALEERITTAINGLELTLKIDRIDCTDTGARVLIDYKTGQAGSLNALFGPRPDAPQLPLYAYALGEGRRPDALAFAHVRRGESRAVGIARDDTTWSFLTPMKKAVAKSGAADWDALHAAWHAEVEQLAHGFLRGDATLDPKHFPRTCDACDQQPLCRMREFATALARGANDSDES